MRLIVAIKREAMSANICRRHGRLILECIKQWRLRTHFIPAAITAVASSSRYYRVLPVNSPCDRLITKCKSVAGLSWSGLTRLIIRFLADNFAILHTCERATRVNYALQIWDSTEQFSRNHANSVRLDAIIFAESERT